jgi:hypothetical protein
MVLVVHLVVVSVGNGRSHGNRRSHLVEAILGIVFLAVELPLPAPVDEEQAGSAEEQGTNTTGDAGDGAGCEVSIATGLRVPL